MNPQDWDDLCRLLYYGVMHTGEIELATKLIQKLAAIDTHGQVDKDGYKEALERLNKRRDYRASEAKRILAEVK